MAAAATSIPDHSTDAFVPRSLLRPSLLNSPLPLASPPFCLVSLVIQSERKTGAIKATAVCYRLQKPGAVVQPSAPIIISAGPNGKSHTLEEKYLICPLHKDQQLHS